MDKQQLFEYVIGQHRYGRTRFRRDDIEMDCPFCRGKFKFSVGITNGRHGCFTCSDGFGSLLGVITARPEEWAPIRSDGPSQRYIVRAREGISLPLWTIDGIPAPLTPCGERRDPSPRLVREAYAYCLHRGMTREQINKYRTSVVAFVRRVYFPFWNEAQQIVFYMGRSISELVEPKTLEPGTNKPLFGLHANEFFPGQMLNIVEGVFDHFQTPNSCAVMGSSLSASQIDEIARLKPGWVNVIFDPDAIQSANRATAMLWRVGIRCQTVRLSGNKDPGDLGRQRMAEISRELEQEHRPVMNRTIIVKGL